MHSELLTVAEVAQMITAGKKLLLAGDEQLLAALPAGDWVGGTTPYFMANHHGLFTKQKIFVTELPACHTRIQVTTYDADSVAQCYNDAPAHGFSFIIIPASSNTHFAFALNAPSFENFAMRPLIGLIDNPYQASQRPLMIDFTQGHAVVFGASGRGKTTFLRTVVTSLALTHSPDELHIYLMDFGGRALTIFSDLPHVGAVITGEEEERVMRMLRKINDIIDYRQILFSEARMNSLDSYNQNFPTKQLPAVLVVLDNFAEFKEYYEGLMGPLISLVREARAYGVHFLFSADLPNSLTGKLFNLITERVTLKLSDTTEYSSIVGRGVPADLSAVPGRGFIRVGNQPLEFQTALSFTPGEGESDDLERIGEMCTRMNQTWDNKFKGERPSKIDTLPLRVTLENLMKQATLPEVRRINALMGIDDRTLLPAFLDVERQGPHMVVIGQPFSGKTTTLRTMILTIAYYYSPDEVMMVLIDYSRKLWKGGETSLENLPHVVQTISDIDELDEWLENMKVECADFDKKPRRRKIAIFIDNYDAFSEESSRKKMDFFEELAGLVRKYQSNGVYVIAAGSVSIVNASDDLRKIITSTNFGIALKSADAVGRLNGRFPRSLADQELPQGRAFTVRSGITAMLQLATPYTNDDDPEGSLDWWVKTIKGRHKQGKAAWLRKPGETPPESSKSGDDSEAESEGGGETSKVDVSKYDVASLKKQLIESGMPEDLLAMLSPSDIIENAKAMGLIPE